MKHTENDKKMPKAQILEDLFSGLQAEAVGVCLAYLQGSGADLKTVDNIYICCSTERCGVLGDFCFRINKKIVKKHTVNGLVPQLLQRKANQTLAEIVEKLIALCKRHDMPVPTQIKLKYGVQNDSLQAEYQYKPVCNVRKFRLAEDVAEEWFTQLNTAT